MRGGWALGGIALLAAAAAPVAAAGGAADPGALARTVRPFLAARCVTCHNAKLATGGLSLQSFPGAAPAAQQRRVWAKILQKLQSGAMPPPGAPQPGAAEVAAVTRWIEGDLNPSSTRHPAARKPERVTARRLNRAEYNNTLRDLLGVDLRPADDFPQDDSGYGFDNIGAVLSLSPVLMEQYVAAAERVTRAAIFGPESLKPTLEKCPTAGRRLVPSPKALWDYDRTGLSLPNASHATHRFPVDGEYHVQAGLFGSRPAGSEPLEIALWVDGRQVQTRTLDPARMASFAFNGEDLSGNRVEFRTRFTAGDHWLAVTPLHMYEGLPASYAGPNPSKRPVPPPPDFSRFFQPPPNATPAQIAAFQRRVAFFRSRPRQKAPANNARVGGIEIAGPYRPATGPSLASRKLVFTCGHLHGGHLPSCPAKIIGDFARRAFRRPVSPQEVDEYLRLYALARQQGGSFDEGICVALQGILISPQFLFRIEPQRIRATPDPYALATRLSYFLWSSTPDEALLRCADQGSLRKPDVLRAQVRRMLQDPKARALVENFGGQWLELRKLESVRPDRLLFPEFDDYLRWSMRRETELFLENLIREDRPILNLIDGRYTFLNERLAEFYGIPRVKGAQFREVALAGNERGGVLTQGSVLTVSSYATRTSPVLRGKWVLANLLNAAPPPPPPGVPNLDVTHVGDTVSLRRQLEAHRANPTCASCHARMDPLGFALENFNAIGQWRTQDGNLPVDNAGTLPDGRTVRGPAGLEAVLKSRPDAFTRCLTEKLLTYALGRGLEPADQPAVAAIVRQVAADDYRVSALVMGIVTSAPFQTSIAQPAPRQEIAKAQKGEIRRATAIIRRE